VHAQAQKAQFIKVQNVYFATLDELETSSISEAICVSRKQQYDEYESFTLPITLSSTIQLPHTSKPQGVSKGIAQGILVTREILDRDTESHNDFPVILYTSLLSPDLTKYFDRIVGIVSESGGLLSHLAIVAREHHLPVVVNVTIREKGFTIGDEVSVDGETGNIERIFSK
jgi:phosphohistidine swiveling domain-containing protein